MSSFFPNACPARWRVRVRATGACLLVLLLLVAPAAGAAAPSPLSLEEAVRMAVEGAPMLDARRAQVEAARQESRRAGALPDPMLMVGIDNLPVTGADAFDPSADFMTMKRIGIRQEVPAGAKRDAREALAARTVEERRAQALAERLDVRRMAAEAWVALWAAQRELTEVTALREQAELASDLARARVSGGTEPAADALAAEASVLELDNRIEAAHAAVEAAQVGLARWIGTPASQVIADMPDFGALPVPEARLLRALDRLGPLLATEAQVETAAAAINLAQAEKRPDWSVAASYGQRSDGREDMFMLEFGIELPLFTANRQDRGIAARRAEYEAALATREDARREQAVRIRADLAQWEALKRQVERDRDALLPLAADRSATALAAYRAGAPIRPWLDARRDELDLVLEHTKRREALGRTWAALAYLLAEEPQQ
ncbi:TolC family protein [Coralloluteibacterium stylophorae]|uniref:TolC family protein n=3 Tax=Coralloluteibacterium stylophorae TaxID=1776034 RepID=A0AAP2FZ97_9GAMM|nr:TolC family protein [Coralloluteibacterium stylophorae]MBS7457904.1 TolC family protein [Coralloluteibacterium stylophorae]